MRRSGLILSACAALAALSCRAEEPAILWQDDFLAFENADHPSKGWILGENPTVEVEVVKGTLLRIRKTADERFGLLRRRLPYAAPPAEAPFGGPYLQVKIDLVENAEHGLELARNGKPFAPLLRVPGVSTFSLGQAREWPDAEGHFTLDLRPGGAEGEAGRGFVDVDWVRLARVPFDGLVVELAEDLDRDGQAGIGDTVRLSYYSPQKVDAIDIRCFLAEGMAPVRLAQEANFSVKTETLEGGFAYRCSIKLTEAATALPAAGPGALLFHAKAERRDPHKPAAAETHHAYGFNAFAFRLETKHAPEAPHEAKTATAAEQRMLWAERTRGENLALGRPVRFSQSPEYRLTKNEADVNELTDGKLASKTDDRIWFARDAVGWDDASKVYVTFDLGAVLPVDRVVARVLGGREQEALVFPARLEVLVSEDDLTYYRAGELHKRGPDDLSASAFELEESGVAYTHPFAFENLKTKARYVALAIEAGSTFLFLDEVAILRGAHDPAGVEFQPEARVQVINSGLAVVTDKDFLAVPCKATAPQYLNLIDMRPKELRQAGEDVPVTLELPEAVELLKPLPAEEPEAFKRDGMRYRRYALYGESAFRLPKGRPIYLTTRQERLQGVARMWVPGYERNAFEVPLRGVTPASPGPLQQLHVSLAWMYEGECLGWPGFFEAWPRLGFNAVATFPRFWKEGQPGDANAAYLDQARKLGLKVIYNESPWHVLAQLRRNKNEIFHELEGGARGKSLCLTYRGEYYGMELERIAQLTKNSRPDLIFHDLELFYESAVEAPRCTHCRQKQKESGKAWDEFLTDTVAEIVRDMDDAVIRATKDAGIGRPRTGFYHVMPSHVYHKVFDWKKLYPSYIDFAMPSLYVNGDPRRVHDAIRENYKLIGKNDIIPWLTAGALGEFDPRRMEAMVLEAILNGSRGITYYKLPDFDTPLDFHYHARALAKLKPFEALIMQGRLFEDAAGDNPELTCTCWGQEEEGLLLVGNYASRKPQKAAIKLPLEKGGARDLESDEKFEIREFTVEVEVPPGAARLFHYRK
ncbi:MAG: hypothetical protein M5U26_09405 [Planctomycetota bacterium]|nr:hypothetical protein [Planctomycetota bacterium]